MWDALSTRLNLSFSRGVPNEEESRNGSSLNRKDSEINAENEDECRSVTDDLDESLVGDGKRAALKKLLCVHWTKGRCAKGRKCRFGHFDETQTAGVERDLSIGGEPKQLEHGTRMSEYNFPVTPRKYQISGVGH